MIHSSALALLLALPASLHIDNLPPAAPRLVLEFFVRRCSALQFDLQTTVAKPPPVGRA